MTNEKDDLIKPPIIVIGYNNPCQDDPALGILASWLFDNADAALGLAILNREYAVYDMLTHPERGDALNALHPDLRLVIALHLYGIDKIPGPHNNGEDYYYNRENNEILPFCMRHHIPLVVWGDQPWLAQERKTPIHDNKLFLYTAFKNTRFIRTAIMTEENASLITPRGKNPLR